MKTQLATVTLALLEYYIELVKLAIDTENPFTTTRHASIIPGIANRIY